MLKINEDNLVLIKRENKSMKDLLDQKSEQNNENIIELKTLKNVNSSCCDLLISKRKKKSQRKF